VHGNGKFYIARNIAEKDAAAGRYMPGNNELFSSIGAMDG
jgi:hypothetical protein